jgi:hypothetical protein
MDTALYYGYEYRKFRCAVDTSGGPSPFPSVPDAQHLDSEFLCRHDYSTTDTHITGAPPPHGH